MIVTFGFLPMTWATTAPTWLFIRVTPAMFEAVWSDLYGLSEVWKVVTGQAPSVRPGSGR